MPNHLILEYWSDSEISDLILLKNQGKLWEYIFNYLNKKYNTNRTHGSVRKAYERYRNNFDMSNKEVQFKQLKEIARTKRSNSKTTKENRIILNNFIDWDDILESVKSIVLKNNKLKFKIPKFKTSKEKSSMTIELMLSDLHFGKITKDFNKEIARKRMGELLASMIREITNHRKIFNVDRIIVALIGDMIESYTMHGIESTMSCEMGNSEQIQFAIEALFWDVFAPLGALGIKIDVPAVTGNHDRTEKNMTYNNPGRENVTYIIYKTLKMLCIASGFKNINFIIPDEPYCVLEIYGDLALYEHCPSSRSNTTVALEKAIFDRSSQIGKLITFYRYGHFHQNVMHDRGRMIGNGSLPGNDSYSEIKGYKSHPTQVINFYIKTKTRPTSFYKSFPVYLGQV